MLLQRQQEHLNHLTWTVASLQTPFLQPRPHRAGPLICRRCQQLGHFARAPWGYDRLQSCHWLQLRAANGLAIPYIGYFELDVTLYGKVFPNCGILVVRDPPGALASAPGILGMNVIRRCYQELFGTHGLALFNLPLVTQAPDSVVGALQQCHQSTVQHLQDLFGTARVRGARAVRIPGGIMQFVASTCPEKFSGQAMLFELPESGLPAGLLASPCLVQVVCGTVHIPVVNVGITEVLLYPHTSLGALSSARVISLPTGSRRLGLPLLRSPLKGPAAMCRVG